MKRTPVERKSERIVAMCSKVQVRLDSGLLDRETREGPPARCSAAVAGRTARLAIGRNVGRALRDVEMRWTTGRLVCVHCSMLVQAGVGHPKCHPCQALGVASFLGLGDPWTRMCVCVCVL